jgi:5-methylcytosine-specific restriction endonuclease McrA
LADRIREQLQCKICGIEFEVRPSEKLKITTCSKECQRKSRKDESNPNWKGGTWKCIAKERRILMAQLEYKTWRKAVFERDNYTCQFCHKRGDDLEADHIQPWSTHPELRYDVNNGRTLCLKCHRTTFKRK